MKSFAIYQAGNIPGKFEVALGGVRAALIDSPESIPAVVTDGDEGCYLHSVEGRAARYTNVDALGEAFSDVVRRAHIGLRMHVNQSLRHTPRECWWEFN